MMLWMDITCALLAAMPLCMTLVNLGELRTPKKAVFRPRVSVLIPARDEESNIGAACRAVLASEGVDLELIVLDDGSVDRTCEHVRNIHDARLRLAHAPALPSGWTGKQHACHVLSGLAQHETLVFMDADVRLAPDALSRMAGFLRTSQVPLASGVPRQIVVSWSEQLLLPLIHFVLLGYLPMRLMRQRRDPRFGAGCGQLIVADRAIYRQVGGHAASRASLHDGLALPRRFRAAGHLTLLFDATCFASCHMYDNFRAVWSGLGKNATEGMATATALPFWTVLLGGGQVLPPLLFCLAPGWPMGLITSLGIINRLVLARRFRQPLAAVWFNPLSVALLLAIQWFSLCKAAGGGRAAWKGRLYGPIHGEAE
jgi:hypothetical protein